MNDARRIAGALTFALAFALPVLPAAASPQGAATVARVAGSYVATHVNGGNVVRLELSLARDGRASLKTGSSRYTQRPEGVAGGTVVETGTWRVRGGQVVLHIETSTSASDDPTGKDKPTFADRMFVLSGCELHLVGSLLAFDKKNCS